MIEAAGKFEEDLSADIVQIAVISMADLCEAGNARPVECRRLLRCAEFRCSFALSIRERSLLQERQH
jgi:hypothetical protein